MSDLEAAVSKDLNVQWWSCFILAPVFFGCTNIISYEAPRTKTLPQSQLRCGLSYSPLQVLFASMATHDGKQFCKQRKGVCSQFWRVTEMENHIEEGNFPLQLWAKQGVENWWLRLWFMLWSPLVPGAACCCWMRAGSEVNNLLWTNRGEEEEGGGISHQLHSEQQAGNSGCFQLVFPLPTALTWLVPAKGVSKPLFSVFLAWVSNVKDLFAFWIWLHCHTQREIIRSLNCRRAQGELVGKSAGIELSTSPRHSDCARDFHTAHQISPWFLFAFLGYVVPLAFPTW